MYTITHMCSQHFFYHFLNSFGAFSSDLEILVLVLVNFSSSIWVVILYSFAASLDGNLFSDCKLALIISTFGAFSRQIEKFRPFLKLFSMGAWCSLQKLIKPFWKNVRCLIFVYILFLGREFSITDHKNMNLILLKPLSPIR